MKNKTQFKFVVLFLLGLATFSCSEESDNNSDTSGDLIGDWEMTSYTHNGSTSTSVEGNTLISTSEVKALNIDYSNTYSENPNKVTTENSSFDIEISTTVNGVNNTQTESFNNITGEANWNRNGNILTFDGDFIPVNTDLPIADSDLQTLDYVIEELTDTSLILSTSLSQEVSESGFTINVTFNARLTFTRI